LELKDSQDSPDPMDLLEQLDSPDSQVHREHLVIRERQEDRDPKVKGVNQVSL